MVKLTSPYNFVPLNKRVYVPSWHKEVSQDIPFEDGEDGWIEVTWKNVSPLIIKEGADKGGSDNKESLPVHVEEADGKRLYFIPGTSMKGMLRSTLEILGFGKMEQYDDRFFGHREFNTNLPEGKKYQKDMKKVKWGWLRKDDDKLFLSPCDVEAMTIKISELEKEYRGFNQKTSQWERNDYIAKKCNGQMFPEIKEGYRLYCTGRMHNKKNELLIPKATEKEKEEELSEETKTSFLTVHEPTPDFEKFIALLNDGQKIPVSYIKGNEEVVAIGLSKMLRLPYKQHVRTLVQKEQPPAEEGKDLCETIFGFTGKTGKDESLRGRVQVSHAFCKDSSDGKELLESVSGVLGEPKPSFYPLYLKQTRAPYKTFNDADSSIAGRKLYRAHTGDSVLPLPQGNDNENVKTGMRPLRPGLTFVMRINLHNMRPVEIGAILSALTLHDTKGAWHNVGSGKSFGYGKLECVHVKLERLKLQKEDYMRAFEKEMGRWSDLKQQWCKTEQVSMLVKILSEHKDEDVRMMTLEEYGDVSKSFQKLEEGNEEITSLLSPEDSFCEEHKEEYAKAEALQKEGKKQDAIKIYDELIKKRHLSGLSADSDKGKRRGLEEEIRQKAKEVKEKEEQTRTQKKEEQLAKGLGTLLGEKYTDGENKGKYKRDTVKKALDMTAGWLKKVHRQELTDQEKQDLYSTLVRLKSHPHKYDKKLWGNTQNKCWQSIEKMIGGELTKALQGAQPQE